MPGLTFRETMSGPFALGVQDPEAGADIGRESGDHLAMHASVSIDDIDRFIDDPAHLGGLAGKVDFTGFGPGIEADRGVFNLFSPSDDPDTKLMIYELGFLHQGVDHYLAGRKLVRNDEGFDLLSDTTTLFTTLHKGTDKGGEIAGAGVLTLGLFDLAKLVTTIRATDTDGAGESAEVIANFGKFFLGELWQQYGPGA